MAHSGLEAAIRAAGGVTELARRVGLSQPSISNWSRIPAERVLAVEAATGIARGILRPDLYTVVGPQLEDADAARGQEYALLATLLADAPGGALLQRLAQLRGDETPLGRAHAALAEAAGATSAEAVEREYFELFIGAGRGELLPYASYYLTGFLHERPLARLRADLQALGIARAAETGEPEDHVAILCEIMAGLVGGPFRAPIDQQLQFCNKHLAPWIGRFFADLEAARAARFYRSVGAIGRVFCDIETQAFALPG